MAQQIGGSFELKSLAGEGVSAILWLPAADTEALSPEPTAAEPALPSHMPRYTILAVDDDALVLMNTAALLEDLGHAVIEADSASHALAISRERNDIDLIVTDQAMPDMTGIELIAAVDELRPDMPLIIASGYGEDVARSGRDAVRLAKPFSQAQLAKAIEAATALCEAG